jgi:acyl-CoA thioesterase
MSADPQKLAEAAAAAMWAKDRASQAMGMRPIAVGPGHATVAMTIKPEMCNGHGTCHGGMIFTLADSAFAFACNSHNRVTVANNCSITFVAPGREGDMLTAAAVESHRGKRSGVCEVRVTNQDGKLIALFRGHSTELGGPLAPDIG